MLIPHCHIAKGFFERFLGLMGRKQIAEDHALLFPKCNSVHTFFMRFPIDVLLVGKDGVVVEIIEAMKPWRMILPRLRAAHTLEMQAHRSSALGIKPGTRLECPGVWNQVE